MPAKPTPPPRLVFLLNSAQRRLQQLIAEAQNLAACNGMGAPSPAQGAVLFVLHKTDGLSMGELSQALALAPSATTGLAQRMEVLGWVRRQPCPLDARTQRLWLQPEGSALLPALHQALKHINHHLTDGFSADELDTVGRWLRHVQQVPHPTTTEQTAP